MGLPAFSQAEYYRQKLHVFEYLTDPAQWHLRDITDWLTSGRRKWSSLTAGDATIRSNKDQSSLMIIGPSYSGVWLRKRHGLVFVRDESGARAVLSRDGIVSMRGDCTKDATENRHAFSRAEQELFSAGWAAAWVRFEKDGRKQVYFDSIGVSISFAKPKINSSNPILVASRFLSEIPLNIPGMEDQAYWQHINAAKLVVARDFGIEPELKAEKESHDCVAVDVPKKFAVQFQGSEHYTLSTDSDTKELIVSHGRIFHQAAAKSPVQAGGASVHAFERLPSLLARGFGIAGSNNKEWRCTIAKSPSGGDYARDIRDTLLEKFCLHASEFFVFNPAPHETFVAVDMDALETGRERYETTRRAAERAEIEMLQAQFDS